MHFDRGEIHVWRISVQECSDHLAKLWQTLAEDEKQRANRFRFAKDREAYIAARGKLRSILSSYLEQEPEQIQLKYSSYGRPSFVAPADFDFNLSHSKDVIYYSISSSGRVGIDVEWRREDVDYERIGRRFFSAPEAESLLSLPSSERMEAFFRCWTRKEAFIKAIGEGLSFPLKDFDVSLLPGDAPMIVRIHGDASAAARWSLFDLDAPPGYAAALAVERTPESIQPQIKYF